MNIIRAKRRLGTIVLAGYLISTILSYLGYVNWNNTTAQLNEDYNPTPLVAVLIDQETYENELKNSDNFKRYVDEYIPSKYPDSQALILSLDLDEYTAPEIVKMLENIYFDGYKDNTATKLIGVIVMGKVPLPVVEYQDYIFPSIYPYVDFIEQKYIWSESEQYFILNQNNGQAECWHGLISLDDGKYDEYFKKLHTYQDDPEKFINKEIWYDDFIALNDNFLENEYKLYKNKMIFAEDLMYHRYTNFLSDILQSDQQDSNAAILSGLSESLNALKNTNDIISKNITINTDLSTGMDTLLSIGGEYTPTKLLQQKIQTFLKDYYEVLSIPLLRTINDNIKASDRRKINDSHYQKLQLKDQLLLGNTTSNGILQDINNALENYVNQKVEKEKYAMKIVLPTYYYRERQEKKGRRPFKKYVSVVRDVFRYFFFGRDAETVTSVDDLSIYRGTYRNLTNFTKYSKIINDTLNPAKSKQDATDLKKRGIGSSYDLFSTQTEANRGYNVLNMQTEYEKYYQKEKMPKTMTSHCVKYNRGIKFLGCVQREWRGEGCNIYDEEDQANCENFEEFANRVFGGASPLNLDMEKFQNQIYELNGGFNRKSARKSAFDIGGSAKVKETDKYNAQYATSFEAATKYISPTKILEAEGVTLKPIYHTINNGAESFFTNPIKYNSKYIFSKISPDSFSVIKSKDNKKDYEYRYFFKIIPSEARHTATDIAQINGYSGLRYQEGNEKWNYYHSIMSGALDFTEETSYYNNLTDSFNKIEGTLNTLKQNIQNINAIDINEVRNIRNIITNSINTLNSHSSGVNQIRSDYNDIFARDYGTEASNYMIAIHSRQIVQSKPISLLSKRYNEINTTINTIKNFMVRSKQQAPIIFNKYNTFYDDINNITGTFINKIGELNIKVVQYTSYINQGNYYYNITNTGERQNNISGITSYVKIGDPTDTTTNFNRTNRSYVKSLILNIKNNYQNTLNNINETINARTGVIAENYGQKLIDSIETMNMIEPCTANHSTLGSIINAPSINIKYGNETSETCMQEPSDECNEENCQEGNNGTNIFDEYINSLNGAQSNLSTYFESDPDNPHEVIEGMNMMTPDRPIDSPRYISFQGVAGNNVKLIYPDIFKVESYKSSGDNIVLKTTSNIQSKDDMYKAITQYLNNKVDEYNAYLRNEKENASKQMDKYEKYYNYINLVDPLATPRISGIRPYSLFTYEEMINAIGGEKMLNTLAELLYYQSVSNQIRTYIDDIEKDIENIQDTFDINKKISYVLKEYLTYKNEKYYKGELHAGDKISYPSLVIPGYNTGGYEVGYINSNGNDNVNPGMGNISDQLNSGKSTRSTNSNNGGNNSDQRAILRDTELAKQGNELKKECGFDFNQALLLYNFSSGKFDRREGVMCWLKNVQKKPVELSITFQMDLGDLGGEFGDPFSDMRENYKNEAKNNFTIESLTNLPKTDNENIGSKTKKAFESTSITPNDRKIKLGGTGHFHILSLSDIGNVIFKVQSTGDNCLMVKKNNSTTNTCNTPFETTIAPYQKGVDIEYSLGNKKAGSIITTVSICTTNDDCGNKRILLSSVPGPISKFNINTDEKFLAGAYTLVEVQATDEDGNEIQTSIDPYTLTASKGKFIIGGGEFTSYEIKDFKNLTILYRPNPTDKEVTFSITDRNGKELKKHTVQIVSGNLSIEKDNQPVSNLTLPIKNESYFINNEINKNKIIPIKLKLKNGNTPIKVKTNAILGTKNNLVAIVTLKKDEENKAPTVKKASSIILENGEADIYLIPGTIAGDDTITIDIPGLEPKTLNIKIKPGEAKNIGITLNKTETNPNEKITGEIFITDSWGNKIDSDKEVKISTSSTNKTSLGASTTIKNGHAKFSLSTTNNDSGIQSITVKTKDDKITGYITFTVKNFFLTEAIESGLNIMYLNIFGNDRGNQRGYNSDNKKFAENIINKSEKTLTITTQLIAPTKVKKTSIIFGKNGYLNNIDEHNITIKVSGTSSAGASFSFHIEGIGEFSIPYQKTNVFAVDDSSNNDWLFQIFKQNAENTAAIAVYDVNENYTYSGGNFFNTQGQKIASIKDVSFNSSDSTYDDYNVWKITKDGEILASAIFAQFDYSKIQGESNNPDYILDDIFEKGGTSSKIKALYSTLETLNNAYNGYDSIQNSDELEKYIGFRGDFKNITLFAEGESVGEATVPFGSEFLINIGDPLLKNRDEIASTRGLGQVMFAAPGKSIHKTIDIDYNNDGLRDLLVIYKDGTISLQKQYASKKFQDMGILMVTAEQIEDVYIGDVDGNRYEDIIIHNTRGQLRVYTNNKGVFDVDGRIVCLNTNVDTNEVTETPESLENVTQIFAEDMDNDGMIDIITLDKKGYLKIFYGRGTINNHSYLSKNIYSCDDNRYKRASGSINIVKRFGIQLLTKEVTDGSIIRRNGLKYPSDEDLEKQITDGNMGTNGGQENDLKKLGLNIPDPLMEKMKKGKISSSDEVKQIIAMTQNIETDAQAEKTIETATMYIKNPFIEVHDFNDPKLKENELAFITINSIPRYNSATNSKLKKVTKKYQDLSGDVNILEEGDHVKVTIIIPEKANTFFDQIRGPWIIDVNEETGAPKDLKFTKGSGTIIAGANGYTYGIKNLKTPATITYTLKYHMDDIIYNISIQKDDPIKEGHKILEQNVEQEDITILRRDGLKYEGQYENILIKNPFTDMNNSLQYSNPLGTDSLPEKEQAFIYANNIPDYIELTNTKEIYPIEKNYTDFNGGELENGDTINVTVRIPLGENYAHLETYFEDIKGPRKLKSSANNFKFTKGSGKVHVGNYKDYEFYIDQFKPAKNVGGEFEIEFTYQLTYTKSTSIGNDDDNLPKFIIHPTDGCVKQMGVINNKKEKTAKYRTYEETTEDLQEKANLIAEGQDKENKEARDELEKNITDNQNNESFMNIPGFNTFQEALPSSSMFENFIGIISSTNTASNDEKQNALKELFKNARDNTKQGGDFDLGNIEFGLDEIFGASIDSIQNAVQDTADKLCNGFKFPKGGNACQGLPVPFNQAFLAPGDYHIMGCIQMQPLTSTLGKGLPVFFWPGNLGPIPIVGYLPIPYMPIGSMDDFLRVKGAGPFSSMIRIYVAPTLTAQVGVAICLGPYNTSINLPSPVSDLGGNCIVTAMSIPCKGKGGGNGDGFGDEGDEDVETYEPRVVEYGKTNSCVTSNNGESPFVMKSSGIVGDHQSRTPGEQYYLGGAITLDYDPISSSEGSSSLFGFADGDQTGIEINGVTIKGAKDMKNALLGGLVQGIREKLVGRFDKQVQYWISNLLRFEVEVTFPDIEAITREIQKIDMSTVLSATSQNGQVVEIQSKLGEKFVNRYKEVGSSLTRIAKSENTKEAFKAFNLAQGANPFKELEDLFNNTDLINISSQNISIKVPRIASEDIEAYKNYLLNRVETNSTTLEARYQLIKSMRATCQKTKGTQEEGFYCNSIENSLNKIVTLMGKMDKTKEQIFQNVQVLEAYKRFPLEIYERLHITDKYLGDIAGLVANFFGYINFWMDVNATRFTQYVDAIITVLAVVKTYQVMIDLFTKRGSKCGKCTVDTYDQNTCKLSFMCPDIPLIEIPNIKIPSLYIDLSSFNIAMDVMIPRFSFDPISIPLPQIPDLPQPPQLAINFDIDFNIPNIPLLPQPPQLPELPSFIPQVKLELPILPPAPEIPEIPDTISTTISIAEQLSNIYCIIKSGIGLVGEKAVKSKIEQLTERSYEIPWVDSLDLTAMLKVPKMQGFDIEVDSYVNLQYNFDVFYTFLKGIVDQINNVTYALVDLAQAGTNFLDNQTSAFATALDNATNNSISVNLGTNGISIDGITDYEELRENYVEKAKEANKQAGEEYKEGWEKLTSFNTTKNIGTYDIREKLKNLSNSLTNQSDKKKVDNILSLAATNTTVKKNEKGIQSIQDEVQNLFTQEREDLLALADLAKNDYTSFLKNLTNYEKEPLQLTYSTNLLNGNPSAEKIIKNNNATEILINTEGERVDGYYIALKNHTPDELNMTEETYNNSMKYLTSIKAKLNERNSIKRKEYAGSTYLTDSNSGKTIKRPLLTATSGTPSTNEAAMNDYSSYVKGVFIKSGDNMINAVNSEYNYNKFQSYYEKDLDKDGKAEVIMRDSNSIYIKYFDGNKRTGKKAIVLTPKLLEAKEKITETQKTSQDIKFEKNIKLYDELPEVKNFSLAGQNFDSISFSWDHNSSYAISGYLMRITERVDNYQERRSSYFDSNTNIRYIVFLENDAEENIDSIALQLNGTTKPVTSRLGKELYEIHYYSSDTDVLQDALYNVPRKREYIQIASLGAVQNGSTTCLIKNSPWSNQNVGGRQIIGDAEGPEATIELLRNKKDGEIISEGNELEGYVGTYYTLKITREDSSRVRKTTFSEINPETGTGKELYSGDFNKETGIILYKGPKQDGLFFTGDQTKYYRTTAIDSQGNETEADITLKISTPGISIENVERLSGYKENIEKPVRIVSELESDIDEGNVSFERGRNGVTQPITAIVKGKEVRDFQVTTDTTTITGEFFDFGNNIGLYSQENKLMVTVNSENGKIEIQPQYREDTSLAVSFASSYPIIKVIQSGKELFQITLQSEKIITTDVHNGTLKKIYGNTYGIFNGGEVLIRGTTPLLYISPTGTLRTNQTNLRGTYNYNDKDKTVTYSISEGSFGDKLIDVTFKVKPLE